MHLPCLTLRSQRKPAFLEHLEHRGVVGENLRDQFLQSGVTRNRDEMAHKRRAEPLPLIRIDDNESHFRDPRPYDDIPPAADNGGVAILLRDCNQGDVLDKIDVHEERDFLLAEGAFGRKETAEHGLRAGTADGREKRIPVARSHGADFHLAPIAQQLHRRKFGRLQRDPPFLLMLLRRLATRAMIRVSPPRGGRRLAQQQPRRAPQQI